MSDFQASEIKAILFLNLGNTPVMFLYFSIIVHIIVRESIVHPRAYLGSFPFLMTILASPLNPFSLRSPDTLNHHAFFEQVITSLGTSYFDKC